MAVRLRTGEIRSPRRLASETNELNDSDRVAVAYLCAGRGCHLQQGDSAVAKGKRTFQPNNRRRARVHGFRLRMRTRAGRGIVANRRRKGRRSLTA